MEKKQFELGLRKDNNDPLLSYEGGDPSKTVSEVKDDLRIVKLDQDGIIDRKFPTNKIRTSKYTALTFLPLNLYTQFSKAANCYFLLIAYMQTIKSISISNGKSAMAVPLSLVVFISMCKDAYEDFKRHASDGEENNK